MKKGLMALVLIALMLAGCGASSKMNNLQLGMTREEVLATMGTPNSTSATANTVFFRYSLYTNSVFPDDYFVRLTDGRVDAFGRLGDFGIGF